ncbi:hypothetical protein ACFVYR_32275 [Streptomyces sp. NPDC058284]|uniref:hypothetical protein n=1 Tax=unclassified Streptomyces TaxID=2593676 RepID=UPI00365FD46E
MYVHVGDCGMDPAPPRSRSATHEQAEATVDNNRPALLFTDDAGVRWRWDSYMKLDEVLEGGTS